MGRAHRGCRTTPGPSGRRPLSGGRLLVSGPGCPCSDEAGVETAHRCHVDRWGAWKDELCVLEQTMFLPALYNGDAVVGVNNLRVTRARRGKKDLCVPMAGCVGRWIVVGRLFTYYPCPLSPKPCAMITVDLCSVMAGNIRGFGIFASTAVAIFIRVIPPVVFQGSKRLPVRSQFWPWSLSQNHSLGLPSILVQSQDCVEIWSLPVFVVMSQWHGPT